MDALCYGQGLGGVIFDCLNRKDEQGNSLLAKVTGGVCSLSLVRMVLKWGADINAVNNRCVLSFFIAAAVSSFVRSFRQCVCMCGAKWSADV